MNTVTNQISINKGNGKASFLGFMRIVISNLKRMEKIGTYTNYKTAYNSFIGFSEGKDLSFDDINTTTIGKFETHLKSHGVTRNTSSCYMRILRAVYNRAVDELHISQQYPFKNVYTGICKTNKRALEKDLLRRMKNANLSDNPSLEFARDMFLFSFYTRGMSFIDMAFLCRNNIKNGYLTYTRQKTGQQLRIKWEKCMETIVNRYQSGCQYLLPIITKDKNKRQQYKNKQHYVNIKLKELSKRIDTPIPISMYMARHSWASIAKCMNVPIDVISEGMGHDSEQTTKIYLKSLDTSTIDKANNLVINCI